MEFEETIPGTSYVIEQHNEVAEGVQKSGSIILHPQPSSDPNDPLNWSRFRKEYHYCLVWIWAFILASAVNWNGPVYTSLGETFNANLNQMNVSSALCYLFLGVGCVILQPLAIRFGRRPVYLLGTVLNIIASVVLGTSSELSALYMNNVLSGVAAAPVDSLVQISIVDTFFLHEHGRRLSIYVFSLYSGSYLAPVAAGYIAEGQGTWVWCAWWLLIISGVLLVVQLFTMDETTYIRKPEPASSDEKLSEQSVEPIPELNNYKKRMRLFHPEQCSDISLLKLFWRPFPTLRYPAIVWCSVVYGVQICWLSLLAITQSEFFGTAPYNFTNDTVGLINLASFIGGFLGMLFASFSDKFQLWMTRKNQGIFEPEFRLWMLAPSGLINVAGLLMYGFGVSYGIQWVLPVFGVGLISFGISACGAIAITYAVDCYQGITAYTMVIILFIRNLLGTLFTFVFQYWLDGMGINNTTIFLAVICLVSNGSFLLFTKWGKTWRKNSAASYYKYMSE